MNDGKSKGGATEIVISTDMSRFELDRIHRFLQHEAYWCRGLPRDVFDRSIAHSLCFGAFLASGEQAAFARIISDRATFAHLCDVFVFPHWRGQGISKALIETVLAHPQLKGLRRFTLSTSDASELYARYGFRPPARPDRLMEIANPRAYLDEEGATA
ncbi:MAG: GNAT family N-acetyltransferase [Hyphomicrobiales bacterium]|nr:GNAT family N-acetyltransferase [Hyphomicrobiales bacterium]MBV9588437.1 GNAT family N-acetyltransferase [Hyphomicrobiales bacterium]MBV9751021.1 GNAT family N-acetyltransferase [Hyphomicrobiales bacterium]